MVSRTLLLDLVPWLSSTTAASLSVVTLCLAECLAERLAGHLPLPYQRSFRPSEPCRW